MKKTAVEWLVSNLNIVWNEKIIDLVEQAKEMEKQQIMDAIEYHIDLLNKTEISDIEIDKEANKFSKYGACITSFFYGAKWYKEQLKKKQ